MKRSRSGYTLIEALVAAVILIIALPLLTRWVLAGRQAQVGSIRSDLATAAAVRAMDSLAQIPRASRDPSLPLISTLYATSSATADKDTIRWAYFNPTAPYATTNTLPGAAYVEVHWKAGSARRVTRLEGVLP